MPKFIIDSQYFDNSGNILSGGTLTFYNVSTGALKNTYAESAETTLNSNPVDLDAYGRPPEIYYTSAAKVVLKSSSGTVIETWPTFTPSDGSAATYLDADADTSITAPIDDQIDFEIGGSVDFTMTANTFTALSGSTIKTNTIAETTADNGVAVDGNKFKDNVQYQTEIAAAIADVAGDGQWWVQNTTPNIPMFTNDAGTDFQLATLAGTETLTNKTLTSPAVNTPTLTAPYETAASVSSSGGTLTLDLATATSFYCTLTENITTITFSNPPASGKRVYVDVEFTQHAASAKTVVTSAQLWDGGTDWVMTTTLSAKDIISYTSRDGFSTSLGLVVAQNVS